MRTFTETECQQFLADPKRIAVLSVAATDGRAPASAPLGYDYTPGGNIRIMTGKGTRKARLMDRAGVVTLVCSARSRPISTWQSRAPSLKPSVPHRRTC